MFSYHSTQKRYLKNFIKHFAKDDNWHNLDLETGNLGYGWIHYSFIRLLRPQRVLCIGSRYGYIPAVCALACKDNQKGRVDFVDAGYDQKNASDEKNHWGGDGFWQDKNKSEKHFKKFGLENYIQLHVMTSVDFKKKYPQRKWSYIHLDGDHSYSGVKKDFNLFWDSLLSGGMMGLHDIHTVGDDNFTYGVNRFWNQLKAKYMAMEFAGDFGMGILQKK